MSPRPDIAAIRDQIAPTLEGQGFRLDLEEETLVRWRRIDGWVLALEGEPRDKGLFDLVVYPPYAFDNATGYSLPIIMRVAAEMSGGEPPVPSIENMARFIERSSPFIFNVLLPYRKRYEALNAVPSDTSWAEGLEEEDEP